MTPPKRYNTLFLDCLRFCPFGKVRIPGTEKENMEEYGPEGDRLPGGKMPGSPSHPLSDLLSAAFFKGMQPVGFQKID